MGSPLLRPRYVAEAADKLGIGRFAVLGVSGGCPYALACGYVLGDRVTRIGIVVGMGPIDATGMKQATAISGPSALGLVRRLQFGMAAMAFSQGPGSPLRGAVGCQHGRRRPSGNAATRGARVFHRSDARIL